MTDAARALDPYPANLPERTNEQWQQLHDRCLTPNYGARRLALVRGEGSWVWDAEGKRYLDFLTGISVCNLGHCHPRITEAIRRQSETLVHCSNLYYIPIQIELARLLVDHCFADRVFFGNSGAEANEAAIKMARRWNREHHGAGRHEIISMENSFHGRTLATLTATGQTKVKQYFDPLVEGFRFVPFNDLRALRDAVTDSTGAILLEPIQGEGGIIPADPDYLRGVRQLCNERGILLIFDEVQCGLGRAGTLFAYEHYGVAPDIMTLAKSLGGGLAMGAMLCTDRLAKAFGPGAHASTMGGNAITSAAALAYVKELIEGGWPARGAEMGSYMMMSLVQATESSALVGELRGQGMMIGLDLVDHAPEVLVDCERNGLLINVTGGRTLRFLPPLNATREQIDQAVEIVAGAIRVRG